MEIFENIPLSTLTTFKTGGSARFLLTLKDSREIPEALTFATTSQLPLIPIGSGSNMLAPDGGVNAVFVHLATNEIKSHSDGEKITITADAGVLWDSLVEHAVENGWWGLENLSAIPGTVGAAVVQNIGAYGAALSDTLDAVSVFDTKDGTLKTFTNDACRFGYRSSIFKEERDRYLIINVTFRLGTAPQPNITYRDLKNYFVDETKPPLQAIREAVVAIRGKKFPPLNLFGTAGSFFLNPIVSLAECAHITEKFPGMPLFPLPEGGVKLPLAWIFDHVLSLKGAREGKAFLWEQQPLVLTAELSASSDEVMRLASRVASAVFENTGITITPEVRLFGQSLKK